MWAAIKDISIKVKNQEKKVFYNENLLYSDEFYKEPALFGITSLNYIKLYYWGYLGDQSCVQLKLDLYGDNN